MLKDNLLVRLVVGIAGGIAVGALGFTVPVRLLATFNSLFGSFLSFTIPLLILAFITNGIAQLGSGSKRTLALTVAIAYSSTIIVGLIVYSVNSALFPSLLAGSALESAYQSNVSTDAYISLAMPPLMSVMTALILSFILGIGIAYNGESKLKEGFEEFHDIISSVISKIIIPFLPLHIAGIFARMTYSGEVIVVLTTFAKVFAIVILLHLAVIAIQYSAAGFIAKKNPVDLIKNMAPAYLTAIGTQSSAATIPVTALCIKKNGVKPQVADFVASLCANIHLSGSMTTITSCALAVLMLSGTVVSFGQMMGFIFTLGIMMVAAPGLPGGAIMAAVGILQANLGFNDTMTALMIALYLTQDSFGTACNVTGDGAIFTK